MTWALPVVAGCLLAFAAVAGRLRGTPITAPIVFSTLGLLLGTLMLDVIDLDVAGEAVKLLAEVTLALVLFVDASTVDFSALRRTAAIPERLLGIGLPLTIAAGFGTALLVLGDLQWPEALLLAVMLAPTDAALGQAVVTDPSVPLRVRQGLNLESGLNDGICVPFFLVALAIAQAEEGALGHAAGLRLVTEQIGYGALSGVVAGALGLGIVTHVRRTKKVDPDWIHIVPVACATLAYTAAVPPGGSGFIGAFVAGLVFGRLRRRGAPPRVDMAEDLGTLFNAVTFLVFGAVMLGLALPRVTWPVVLYAVASLTVVRMVPVGLAFIGCHIPRVTVAFLGWFGPRGLASIVFAILVLEGSHPLPHESILITTVTLTIWGSVLAHGLTAAPVARWYGRRVAPAAGT